MKTILISTIVRNRAQHLNTWISQIKRIVELLPDYNFYLSVYENDSSDNSKQILHELDYSFLKGVQVQTENLRTNYYSSVVNEDRVTNLANARNKTLFYNDFLEKSDYVLCIEPDISYSPEAALSIIQNDNYDIISGVSLVYGNKLYDSWATRLTEDVEWWDLSLPINGKQNVWSTFNCFCKYKSELIKNGVGFQPINPRTNAYDCDTVVICELFRKNGKNKICFDGDFVVHHNN